MRIHVPTQMGRCIYTLQPLLPPIPLLFYRYRLAVLRALPQLQKLDNAQVTQEELREAQRKGRALTHPEDPHETEEEDEEEEEYISTGHARYPNDYPVEQEYSPQRSPSRQEVRFDQTIFRVN